MNNGSVNLFVLSAIVCKLSECLNENELSILSANLSALGDMIEVTIAQLPATQLQKEHNRE